MYLNNHIFEQQNKSHDIYSEKFKSWNLFVVMQHIIFLLCFFRDVISLSGTRLLNLHCSCVCFSAAIDLSETTSSDDTMNAKVIHGQLENITHYKYIVIKALLGGLKRANRAYNPNNYLMLLKITKTGLAYTLYILCSTYFFF